MFLIANLDFSYCGVHITIGASFARITRAVDSKSSMIKDAFEIFENQPFAILTCRTSKNLYILLRKDIKPVEIMESYARALIGVKLHGSDTNVNLPN